MGPWEPGALGAALILGGLETAGGALLLPFGVGEDFSESLGQKYQTSQSYYEYSLEGLMLKLQYFGHLM